MKKIDASHVCQFLILEHGVKGAPRKLHYFPDEQVEVRDIGSMERRNLLAGEVTPYRHALYIDGRLFDILNIIKSPVRADRH